MARSHSLNWINYAKITGGPHQRFVDFTSLQVKFQCHTTIFNFIANQHTDTQIKSSFLQPEIETDKVCVGVGGSLIF